MRKPLRLPKFWVLAWIQVVLILVGAVVWFYYRTEAYLAGPPDIDTYSWSWGYQLLMFAFFWLPATLVCTVVLLAVERALLAPYYRAAALQGPGHGP